VAGVVAGGALLVNAHPERPAKATKPTRTTMVNILIEPKVFFMFPLLL
jgi:hypothetical protein